MDRGIAGRFFGVSGLLEQSPQVARPDAELTGDRGVAAGLAPPRSEGRPEVAEAAGAQLEREREGLLARSPPAEHRLQPRALSRTRRVPAKPVVRLALLTIQRAHAPAREPFRLAH